MGFKIEVSDSWTPAEVTIKTKIGAEFSVTLEDMEIEYHGEDMQIISIKGRTIA